MTHCWHLLVSHINTDNYRTAGARLDVRSFLPVDAQTDENSHCSVKFTVLFLVEGKTILITYRFGRKEVISIVRSSWCRCPGNLIVVLLSSPNYLGVAMFCSGESNSEITARSLAYPGGGVQNPPKFRSFENAGPNSQFCGIYIYNNLIRIRVSLIYKLSETPN
jgi:hypothetical protein